ncbi:MAG TPA: ABC transporter C-terminal domain-containing protein, partial [Candidatus Eremiobacteraceae bacterium]|nr:ABC transporter C-terminal domain-containing protein [Candidatus Eremiobacteraceae bacterium]
DALETASYSSPGASDACPRTIVREKLSKNRRAALERESAELEAEIVKLDARRADIEDRFASPQVARDGKRVKALCAELEEVDRASAAALAAWELAVESLDADAAQTR